VYRAKDTRLGRDVALKIFPESIAREIDRLQRFEQEARAGTTRTKQINAVRPKSNSYVRFELGQKVIEKAPAEICIALIIRKAVRYWGIAAAHPFPSESLHCAIRLGSSSLAGGNSGCGPTSSAFSRKGSASP